MNERGSAASPRQLVKPKTTKRIPHMNHESMPAAASPRPLPCNALPAPMFVLVLLLLLDLRPLALVLERCNAPRCRRPRLPLPAGGYEPSSVALGFRSAATPTGRIPPANEHCRSAGTARLSRCTHLSGPRRLSLHSPVVSGRSALRPWSWPTPSACRQTRNVGACGRTGA